MSDLFRFVGAFLAGVALTMGNVGIVLGAPIYVSIASFIAAAALTFASVRKDAPRD